MDISQNLKNNLNDPLNDTTDNMPKCSKCGKVVIEGKCSGCNQEPERCSCPDAKKSKSN